MPEEDDDDGVEVFVEPKLPVLDGEVDVFVDPKLPVEDDEVFVDPKLPVEDDEVFVEPNEPDDPFAAIMLEDMIAKHVMSPMSFLRFFIYDLAY